MVRLETSTEEWPGYHSLEDEEAKKSWDATFPDTFRECMPAFFHTFSEKKIRQVAEEAGFVVGFCDLTSGALSGYPCWALYPMSSDTVSERFKEKEQVTLIAMKPDS